MKKPLLITIVLLSATILGGCASAMDPAYPTATYPAPITTEPSPPTQSPQPTATDTPAPTLTPTPFQPFEAVVNVEGLLLRSGPGFLHEAYWTYPQGEIVQVLGRAPGWGWVYVQTANNLLGWMKLELLDLKGDFYDAPEVTPEDAVIVKGHVYTPNGNPASHISLSLTPVEGDVSNSDNATTDTLGQYYFFLPKGSRGTWTLAGNAYGCESNAVNDACELIGYFPPPLDIDVREASEFWFNLQIRND